jgi:hypothetical protein
LECKANYNVAINTKALIDFDCWCQLHIIDRIRKNKYMSWEFTRLIDYCKKREKIEVQIISVWWNRMILTNLKYG